MTGNAAMSIDLPTTIVPFVYTDQRFCENTLDDADLQAHCPLDNGKHQCSLASQRHALGTLETLPNELLVDILLFVDIPVLTVFRRVNRCAMAVVDSIAEYASLVRHCPDIVRACISLKARGFDCRTLYDTLSTFQCATCDNFGNYLYLVSCKRVCHSCYTTRLEYLPLSKGQVRKASRNMIKKSRTPLRYCSSILSLRGGYTRWHMTPGDLHYAYKRRRIYDRLQVDPGLLQPRCNADLRPSFAEPLRYVAIITAPCLSPKGADWGYFCIGCEHEANPKNHRDNKIKYTKQGIQKHMEFHGLPVPILDTQGRTLYFHPQSPRLLLQRQFNAKHVAE